MNVEEQYMDITGDGAFDPAKLPIDSTLQQCVGSDLERFRSGCRLLATMVSRGRAEAGVFLLGLLRYYEEDLDRLAMIVDSLAEFQDARCAAALFGELRRVRSSNTTRRYLDIVIRTSTLVERSEALAVDVSCSDHSLTVVLDDDGRPTTIPPPKLLRCRGRRYEIDAAG